VVDGVFDGTIPYDLRFFQSLDRIVQVEPWQTRDKVMIDVLKSIGIEKGKAFTPSPRLQETLQAAAREARASFNARFETAFPPFYPGEQWVGVAPPEIMETMGTFYEKSEMYAVDARALVFYYAFSSAKHLGAGQFYLWSMRDRNARFLDGGSTYRLIVPPMRPALAPQLPPLTIAPPTRSSGTLRPGRSHVEGRPKTKAVGGVELTWGRTLLPQGIELTNSRWRARRSLPSFCAGHHRSTRGSFDIEEVG
jgi:hypothetical protein